MGAYWNSGGVSLYHADARSLPLEDGSVHCVVTSPPYYGLRVYAGNDARGIGLEQTPEEYIANLVEVFREVWRVLRDDGVVWVNLGDSRLDNPGILAIPSRVALALQADGWILRQDVIWAKKSAMPESLAGWHWEQCRLKGEKGRIARHGIERGSGHVDESDVVNRDDGAQWSPCPGCDKCRDNDGLVLRKGSWRCTTSHEHIFMLVKAMGYYADGEAVKEGLTSGTHSRGPQPHVMNKTAEPGSGIKSNLSRDAATWGPVSARNRRSIWNDIAPKPFPGQHFATFPPDLPRICIQASTSERGCCPACGRQWARVVKLVPTGKMQKMADGWDTGDGAHGTIHRNGREQGEAGIPIMASETIDWRPTCRCPKADPVPALVLDPFAGTATTCEAAQKLGRRAVGVDLSKAYLDQAVTRLLKCRLPLFDGQTTT